MEILQDIATRRARKPFSASGRRSGFLYGALMTGASVFAPGAALAQTAPQTDTARGRLPEIVVTAAKREGSVQTTPITITAITGAELQAKGVSSIASLLGDVPGLSARSAGPGQTEFELRGLSSNGGTSPTVGFYLDDIPLSPAANSQIGKVVLDPDLYDLARVEVLRGPQGTLYGSGSLGGTIRLITNQPQLDAFALTGQFDASGTHGGGFNRGERAAVNIPLVKDVLALRVVGTEKHDSGWLDRDVVGDFPGPTNGGLTRGDVAAAPILRQYKDVNDAELKGVRATLLFKPVDQLTITPMFLYQTTHQNGLNTFDSDPGTNAHYQPFDDNEYLRDSVRIYALTANYKLGGVKITSATSYMKRNEAIKEDAAENLALAFGLSVYPQEGGIGGGPDTEFDRVRQFSQEVRLSSNTRSRFQWLVGGFYSHLRSQSDVIAINPAAAALFGTANIVTDLQPFRIDQEAGFGEAEYALTDTLKATAGIRYYHYSTHATTFISGIASPSGSDDVIVYPGRQASSGVNPKFNLSYRPTSNLMIYGTMAKGVRPGGSNLPVPNNPDTVTGQQCLASLAAIGKTAAPDSFGPDSVWSYEVGEKLSLNHRITINGAAYYENWKGVQQTIALSCGYPYTDNAGDAHVYGAELELRAIITSNLTAVGTVGYTHAALAGDNPETGGKKGDPLQSIAPWTAGGSLIYTRPWNDRWTLNARVSANYIGHRIDATYLPNNPLPAYVLANARLGLSSDRWSIAMYLNNFLNKRAQLSDALSLSVNLPTFNRVATNQPFTGGVEVSFKFK